MDKVTQITMEATEQIDEFMFKVMRPYCEDVSEMKMKKDDLKDALMLWKESKPQKPKTITKQLEEIFEDFCNNYCKYPVLPIPEGREDNWLSEDEDSPCETCPLNRI